MAKPSKSWTPGPEQISGASEHVAWEYVSLLAAAREMARGHGPPLNHEVQESFLVHVRNLAEFLCKGVEAFRQTPGQLVPRSEARDNIYAVDFCSEAKWDEMPLRAETKLRRAIDKTLSHMTYSRDLRGPHLDAAFDGRFHVHGTLKLILKTWRDFRTSMHPDLHSTLDGWISRHAAGMNIVVDDALKEFEEHANASASRGEWRLNQTPDGVVS